MLKYLSNMSIDSRHAVYVWWLTFACLTGIMLLAYFKQTDQATEAIKALASIMTYVVCSYLGIEMISRSNVLDKLGDKLQGNTNNAPPVS